MAGIDLRSPGGTAGIGSVGPRNVVVWMGDSRTVKNGNGINLIGDNYTGYIPALLGGQLVDQGPRYATAGYTLEQIETTHLPTVLALSGNQKPAWAVIDGGTNNMPTATFNLTTMSATLGRLCAALLGASIRPILTTVPPRGGDSAGNLNVLTWNAWIKRYAQVNGFPLLDWHAAVVDPATGVWKSGLSLSETPDVHQSPAGAKAMALAVYQQFGALLQPWTQDVTDNVLDGQNIIPTGIGLFITDSNADGVADGWNKVGLPAGVGSLVNDGLIPGKWQRLTRDASTGGWLLQGNFYAATVGHRYALSCKFRTSGMSATTTFSLTLDFQNGSVGNMAPVNTWTQDLSSGILCAYMEFVAPSGTTNVRANIAFTATVAAAGAYLDVGQMTVRDLTAIGYA